MSSVRRLFQLLQPRWPMLLATAALMGVGAGSTAMYAWLAGPLLRVLYASARTPDSPLVDWGLFIVGDTPAEATLGLAILFGAVAVARSAASYGQHILLARISQDTINELRLQLYNHLLALAPGSLLGHRSGELGNRIASEVSQVQGLISLSGGTLARNVITSITLISLAFSLDPVLAGVAVLGIPPLGWTVARLSSKARQAHRDRWEAESRLVGTATESAPMVPLVRAYQAEEPARAVFADQAERARAHALEAARLRAKLGPSMELMGAAAVLGALGLGAVRLRAGLLEPEACVSLFAALVLVYRPVQTLGRVVHGLAGGLSALERIDELLSLKPEPPDPPDAPELPRIRRELRLEDVHFSYGNHEVLRGVDLTVRAGESVGIVGPSGEGKTTLLLVMLGLVDPIRGTVRIDGHDVRDVQRASVRRQFGWVGQHPLLFTDTVLNNIALGEQPPDRERARTAARLAGVAEVVEALPQGYDTPLHEEGANLSAGERQRICIARALYRDAPVLVLDEPTAALDAQAERALSETLNSLLGSRTVVLASHRESTIGRVDRVAVMSEGRIVEEGSPAELQARGAVYRTLLHGERGPEAGPAQPDDPPRPMRASSGNGRHQ